MVDNVASYGSSLSGVATVSCCESAQVIQHWIDTSPTTNGNLNVAVEDVVVGTCLRRHIDVVSCVRSCDRLICKANAISAFVFEPGSN